MHLLRFDTIDGIVYLPADRIVALAAGTPSHDNHPRTVLTSLSSNDKVFTLLLACEVDEVAAALESAYRACEVFRVIA